MKRIFIDGDRHNGLELPDGRIAAHLRLEPLRTELQRLQIDGIQPTMNKSELLDCFWVQATNVALV